MLHHVGANYAPIKKSNRLGGWIFFINAPLLLLFRKRSRLFRLCSCKRGHNGSTALPTFFGLRLRIEISFSFGFSGKESTHLSFLALSKKYRKPIKGITVFWLFYLQQHLQLLQHRQHRLQRLQQPLRPNKPNKPTRPIIFIIRSFGNFLEAR